MILVTLENIIYNIKIKKSPKNVMEMFVSAFSVIKFEPSNIYDKYI